MRAPFQVLVILYRKKSEDIEYAVFYRNKSNICQFVSGGGEDEEKPIETVVRELREETQIKIEKEDVVELASKSTIPVLNIVKEYLWGKNTYVVCEHTFAVNIKDSEIVISDEHKGYKWLKYEEAMEKLKFDSNKNALWELNEKLKNGTIQI